MSTNDLERRMAKQQNVPAQQQQRPASLADNIKAMEQQFQLAAPKGAEASQLVRDALTALRQNPQLAQCSQASVLGGLMTLAQLGLRPGVLGQAWLIPFKDYRQGMVAQLVIGYQGLVELAHRSGKIQSLIARTVYEHDTFDVDYGLEDKLVHKPYMGGDKGAPIAYYAVAKFTTGGHAFYVMSHAEMEIYRERHVKAKKGPWVDHYESMAHKTCVRQLSKWMPKSTELATGLSADNSVRVDLAPAAVDYTQQPDGEIIDGSVEIDGDAATPQEPSGAPTAPEGV